MPSVLQSRALLASFVWGEAAMVVDHKCRCNGPEGSRHLYSGRVHRRSCPSSMSKFCHVDTDANVGVVYVPVDHEGNIVAGGRLVQFILCLCDQRDISPNRFAEADNRRNSQPLTIARRCDNRLYPLGRCCPPRRSRDHHWLVSSIQRRQTVNRRIYILSFLKILGSVITPAMLIMDAYS